MRSARAARVLSFATVAFPGMAWADNDLTLGQFVLLLVTVPLGSVALGLLLLVLNLRRRRRTAWRVAGLLFAVASVLAAVLAWRALRMYPLMIAVVAGMGLLNAWGALLPRRPEPPGGVNGR